MKFHWEQIDNSNSGLTWRAKVFGGWIVRTCDTDDCNRHYVV